MSKIIDWLLNRKKAIEIPWWFTFGYYEEYTLMVAYPEKFGIYILLKGYIK